MESGAAPPDRPSDGDAGGDASPLGGPQAPAPGLQAPPPGPQAPGPGGPPAPSPGPSAPDAPQYPGPAAPAPAPHPGPTALHPEAPGGQPPAYGGPVPPGGWQAPLASPQVAWAGAPLASWGSRVGAALLDGLILIVPTLVLGGLVVGVFVAGSNIGGILLAVIFAGIYLVALLLYAPVLMARSGEHNGQTWGKQIVGITVIKDNSDHVDFGYAFLREVVVKNVLFGWVGSLLLYIPTLLNYLWPLWDDQNRCLHDMVVSTHVVKRP